jgi:twitching motility protein PilT
MIDVFPPHQQPQIRSQLSNILMAICAQRLIPAIGGGRVVAAEVLVANSAVRSVIREGKTHQLDTIIQTGADQYDHCQNHCHNNNRKQIRILSHTSFPPGVHQGM